MNPILTSTFFFVLVAITALEASPADGRVRFQTLPYYHRPINRNPPMRSARSLDDREEFVLAEESELDHQIEKRDAGRKITMNYKPPPPNGPRYARAIEEEPRFDEYEPEVDHIVEKREDEPVSLMRESLGITLGTAEEDQEHREKIQRWLAESKQN